jgi:uridine kinase
MTPLVVGIAGGTASGKTTVARKIHEALAPCVREVVASV